MEIVKTGLALKNITSTVRHILASFFIKYFINIYSCCSVGFFCFVLFFISTQIFEVVLKASRLLNFLFLM